jgi:protein TonB
VTKRVAVLWHRTNPFGKIFGDGRKPPKLFGIRGVPLRLMGRQGMDARMASMPSMPSMPDEPLAGYHSAERPKLAPLSDDAGAEPRRALATAAAFFVHAAAIALVLVKLPIAEPPAEPPPIPVEVVAEAAPKPEAQAKPSPQPESSPQPQVSRESGGDLAPGQAPVAAVTPIARPVPKPRPPAPAQPLSAQPVPDLSSPAEQSTVPVPAESAPPPSETEQALIPVPQPYPPLAEWPDTSPRRGEGGGDPYLNAVRDSVLRHFVYPSAANSAHVTGTAQYEITLDRQGRLLGVRLLQSSGNGILDEAGTESIEHAAPFGPLPSDVVGERVGLVFTFYMGL